jgi:hypothetical protein
MHLPHKIEFFYHCAKKLNQATQIKPTKGVHENMYVTTFINLAALWAFLCSFSNGFFCQLDIFNSGTLG